MVMKKVITMNVDESNLNSVSEKGAIYIDTSGEQPAMYIHDGATVGGVRSDAGAVTGGGGDYDALNTRVTNAETTINTHTSQISTHTTQINNLIANGGGGGGTGTTSRPMRTVQRLYNHLMSNHGRNRLESSNASVGTVNKIGSVPIGFTREYPITEALGPWQWYGGDAHMDDWGIRIDNASFDAQNPIVGRLGYMEVCIIGDGAVFTLEKGYRYRFLVEENGVFRYLPELNMTSDGSGQQLIQLALPSLDFWRIQIEVSSPDASGNRTGRIGKIYTRYSNSALVMSKREDLTAVFIGSSSIMGVGIGQPWAGGSWSNYVTENLGIKNARHSAVHSTTAYTSLIGANKWVQRRNDVIVPNPDVVFYHCQYITDSVQGEIDAVMAEVTNTRANLPNAVIFLFSGAASLEEQSRRDAHSGVKTAIENLNDPFIRLIDTNETDFDMTDLIGYPGNEGAQNGNGPADWLLGANDHYSIKGDRVTGRQAVMGIRRVLEDMYYGNDSSSEPVFASIFPTSSNQNMVINVAVDILLGTISNGTPTGSPTGAVPTGLSLVYSGQQLRLQGTPTALTSEATINVGIVTDNGNTSFSLTTSVTATPVVTITPNNRTVSLTVNSVTDESLGTISNGTPISASITNGSLPAGLSVSIVGQVLHLVGTPTEIVVSIDATATVVTDNGNVSFVISGNVAAASGGSDETSDPFKNNVVLYMPGDGIVNHIGTNNPEVTVISGTPTSVNGWMHFVSGDSLGLADFAIAGFNYNGPSTIDIKFKLGSVPTASMSLFSLLGNGAGNNMAIELNSTAKPMVWNASSTVDWVSENSVLVGDEHEISVSYTGDTSGSGGSKGTCRVHFDGVMVYEIAGVDSFDWNQRVRLANRGAFGPNFFEGDMKVRVTLNNRRTTASYSVGNWYDPTL